MLDSYYDLPIVLQWHILFGCMTFLSGMAYLVLEPEYAAERIGRMNVKKQLGFLLFCIGAPSTVVIAVIWMMIGKVVNQATKSYPRSRRKSHHGRATMENRTEHPNDRVTETRSRRDSVTLRP